MLFLGCSQRAFNRSLKKFLRLKELALACAEAFKAKGKTARAQQIVTAVEHLTEQEKKVSALFVQGSTWAARSEAARFCRGVRNLKAQTRSFSYEIGELCFFVFAIILLRTFVIGYYGVPTGSAEKNMLVGDRVWGNKIVYYLQKPQYGEMLMFEDPEFTLAPEGTASYYWQKYMGIGVSLFNLPEGPRLLTKRVIGLPGDVVEGKIEDHKPVIYRNGKRLNEPYLNTYPLITVYKYTGFFSKRGLAGTVPLPSFLRKEKGIRRYSYDPEKSFDEQPFYQIPEEDICRHPGTGDPILLHPNDSEPEDTFGPLTVPEGHYWVMGDSRRNSRDSRFWGFLPEKLVLGRLSFILFSVDGEEAFWLFEWMRHPVDFWTKYVRWDRSFKWLTQWNGFDGMRRE